MSSDFEGGGESLNCDLEKRPEAQNRAEEKCIENALLQAASLVEFSVFALAGEVESGRVCRLISLSHELENFAKSLNLKNSAL